MRVIAPALPAFALVAPAVAHGPEPVLPETLWRTWSFDPVVLGALLLAVWLYLRGLRALRQRAGAARIIGDARAIAGGLGIGALFIALVSPLDPLGGTLLSAHMAQHALLVAVAPPLLLYARPGAAFFWALPAIRKARLLGSPIWRFPARLGRWLSRPLPAATSHGLVIWGWHAPAAFDAALASDALHVLEHVSFFGTALLFWSAILRACSPERAAAALGAAFTTLMQGGLLGALITLAPRSLYIWYAHRPALWGWTPLEDQQLAGLLMWVPLGVVYLGVCLWLASRLVLIAGKPAAASAPHHARPAFRLRGVDTRP